jgi:hypothetical protein
MTLEQYFKKNLERDAIDHALRASVTPDGNVTFYIHADGRDSDTLDFFVNGNQLIPIPQIPSP